MHWLTCASRRDAIRARVTTTPCSPGASTGRRDRPAVLAPDAHEQRAVELHCGALLRTHGPRRESRLSADGVRAEPGGVRRRSRSSIGGPEGAAAGWFRIRPLSAGPSDPLRSPPGSQTHVYGLRRPHALKQVAQPGRPFVYNLVDGSNASVLLGQAHSHGPSRCGRRPCFLCLRRLDPLPRSARTRRPAEQRRAPTRADEQSSEQH